MFGRLCVLGGMGNFYAEKRKHSLDTVRMKARKFGEEPDFAWDWIKGRRIYQQGVLVSVREKPNPPGSG